jgi:hypothetical protein
MTSTASEAMPVRVNFKVALLVRKCGP